MRWMAMVHCDAVSAVFCRGCGAMRWVWCCAVLCMCKIGLGLSLPFLPFSLTCFGVFPNLGIGLPRARFGCQGGAGKEVLQMHKPVENNDESSLISKVIINKVLPLAERPAKTMGMTTCLSES